MIDSLKKIASMQNSSTPERIKYVIDKFYKGRPALLAHDMCVVDSGVRNLICENPAPCGQIWEDRFWNVGISIDWLKYGAGSMYAMNKIGDQKLKDFEVRDYDGTIRCNGRFVPVEELNDLTDALLRILGHDK